MANAVVSGIMRKFFDSTITAWLKYKGSDWISLVGQFQETVGYGFRKGEEKLEENLRKACLVLIKDGMALESSVGKIQRHPGEKANSC